MGFFAYEHNSEGKVREKVLKIVSGKAHDHVNFSFMVYVDKKGF